MPNQKIEIKELYLIKTWFITICFGPVLLILLETLISPGSLIGKTSDLFFILIISIVGGMWYSLPWLIGMSLFYLLALRWNLTEFVTRALFLIAGLAGIMVSSYLMVGNFLERVTFIYCIAYCLAVAITNPQVKKVGI